MSNQSTDGFQGSQPFITDKQFQNLSLDEIRHIIAEEKEELKKDYKELGERRKLIKQYKKLLMMIINMLKMYGILLNVKQLEIITIFTYSLMSYFCQMYLKTLGKLVSKITT